MSILAKMFQEDKLARTHLYDKRDELAKAQGLTLRAPANCAQNHRVRNQPKVGKGPKKPRKEPVEKEKDAKQEPIKKEKGTKAEPVVLHGAEASAWVQNNVPIGKGWRRALKRKTAWMETTADDAPKQRVSFAGEGIHRGIVNTDAAPTAAKRNARAAAAETPSYEGDGTSSQSTSLKRSTSATPRASIVPPEAKGGKKKAKPASTAKADPIKAKHEQFRMRLETAPMSELDDMMARIESIGDSD